MLRHFIELFITKYGRSKTTFEGTLKILLGTVNSRNSVKDVAMTSTVCLLKRKTQVFTGVCSGVGLLSGCCFSKSSGESEPIMEATEDLVAAVEQNTTVSEKLSTTAENLREVNIDLLQSNEDLLLGHFIQSECSDKKDKAVENEQNNVIDKGMETKGNDIIEKENNNSAISEHVGVMVDNDIVYKPDKRNKRRKLNKTMYSKRQEDGFHTGAEKRKREERRVKVQPNYFVSFQVSNPEIHGKMSEVQSYIINQNEKLGPSLVSISRSHITLMVIRLNNESEHSKALDVLKIIHKEFNKSVRQNPLKLCFKGIGNFRNKVIFAKLQDDDGLSRLQNFAERVVSHFEDASIMSTDVNREFNPHLTLMKLSKDPTLFRKGVRKIDPSLYKPYEDQSFGIEVIKSIQLLSMQGPADENGYYIGTDLPFDVPPDN